MMVCTVPRGNFGIVKTRVSQDYMHENDLKGVLKYKLLDLNFRVSDLEGEIERSVS